MNEHTPNDDPKNIDINFDGETPETNSQDAGATPVAEAVTIEAASGSQQIEALKDQLLRKAAEFENFRRRTREEQTMLVKYGNEGLILELLPVLDDFARSLKSGIEHPDFDAFYKGTELVRNKLVKVLESRGLKPIESAGKPFDEHLHDALLQIPSKHVSAGTVIDEVETGYLLHERVIRHAKVTVAADPSV